MDKNKLQAQRIYDVFQWLDAPKKAPHTSLQLVNDLEEVQKLIDQQTSIPAFAAKRVAITTWMTQYVFKEIEPPSVSPPRATQ